MAITHSHSLFYRRTNPSLSYYLSKRSLSRVFPLAHIYPQSLICSPNRTGMGSGNVPEFGAIFMSNTRTRKECFQRKLFGLPYLFADFVKAVKSGMILFLFDYENKNLYGVFEAASDGAIDIVPHAYSSSGKKFPAQIRFNVIWNCGPLPERNFRNAIKENYYGEYKFNFGLSKEQVYSLLRLFESRKVRVRDLPMGKSKKSRSPSVDSGIVDPKKGAPTVDSQDSKSVSVHKKTEQTDVSSCTSSLGLEDYIPLSFPESPEPLEDPSDNDLKLKGMYSDLHLEKASVFSRLNLGTEVVEQKEKFETKDLELVSKFTCQMDQNKVESGKYVNEIMERMLQRQRKTKRNVPASGVLGKRRNVFSRLNFSSEVATKKRGFRGQVGKFNEMNQCKKKYKLFHV